MLNNEAVEVETIDQNNMFLDIKELKYLAPE